MLLCITLILKISSLFFHIPFWNLLFYYLFLYLDSFIWNYLLQKSDSNSINNSLNLILLFLFLCIYHLNLSATFWNYLGNYLRALIARVNNLKERNLCTFRHLFFADLIQSMLCFLKIFYILKSSFIQFLFHNRFYYFQNLSKYLILLVLIILLVSNSCNLHFNQYFNH